MCERRGRRLLVTKVQMQKLMCQHGSGRRLLVTKVQMEILVVGRFPINFVTPISIHYHQNCSQMIDNIVADHLLLSDYRLECWLLNSQKSCDGSGGGGSGYNGSQKSMLRDRVTWDIPNVANNASPHIRKKILRPGAADTECQGKLLPDAECQGKCRPDDACHGICLLDAKCQGICHPDEARFLQTETVNAIFSGRRVSRKMSSERRVPRHLPSGLGVSGHLPSGRSAGLPDAECQGKCRPDDACHGICLLDEESQGICHSDAAVSYRRRVSRQIGSRRGLRWRTTHR